MRLHTKVVEFALARTQLLLAAQAKMLRGEEYDKTLFALYTRMGRR